MVFVFQSENLETLLLISLIFYYLLAFFIKHPDSDDIRLSKGGPYWALSTKSPTNPVFLLKQVRGLIGQGDVV